MGREKTFYLIRGYFRESLLLFCLSLSQTSGLRWFVVDLDAGKNMGMEPYSVLFVWR